MAGDRQAQARPTTAHPRPIDLVEALEDAFGLLARHARARVLDDDLDPRTIRLDADVQAALRQIEDKASNSAAQSAAAEPAALASQTETTRFRKKAHAAQEEIDDGRKTMHKIFVESKIISAGDFNLCWHTPDLAGAQPDVAEPFVQMLNDKGLFPMDKSLKLLADKSRTGFLPLDRYDVDMDLLRGFPADVCRRWCVAPFDRMSKSILVATANPFNQQAVKDLAEATTHRLLWYLAPPADLISNLRTAFR